MTQALAEGPLGAALLPVERGDLAAARPLLAAAVDSGVSTGADASLFHGAPALEFVLSRAGHPGWRVRAATDRVTAGRLAAARRRRESGRLPGLAEFDLIQGIAGLTALLLSRDQTPPLALDALRYLASLQLPVTVGGRELPGWWTPGGPAHQEAPGGHANNGVAHGAAGILSMLAIAALTGVRADGQEAAIEVLASWLETWGASWWITLPQLSAGVAPQPPPLRPSWCYGTLGVARALQLAGLAAGNGQRRQAAEDTALAALGDPERLARVTDASLCHGWAGILTVTRAIAADSPAPERFAAATRLARARLDAGIGSLPRPGFLEGRAGAQLALDGTDSTGWTRALLIRLPGALMHFDDDNLMTPEPPDWHYVFIRFPGSAGVTPQAATALATALAGHRYHFTRKEDGLRLRTTQDVGAALSGLAASGLVAGWHERIYEPENRAFGGAEGMDIAHGVFCADSPAALAATGTPGGKERAVLLISAMTRAAALDPFETGDVWARLASLRPPASPPSPERRAAAIAAMRRLLTADAARRRDAEPGWAARVTAFEDAGRKLAFLDAAGLLARGLRSVLAHHLIFAFNRAGVPAPAQAAAAWLAVQAAFGDGAPAGAFTPRAAAATPTISRMETITATTTPDPARLRAAMVGSLTAGGHLRTPQIITAFTETRRHLFLPGATLEAAYDNDAVPVKHDDDGTMISCISAPSIIATQLEQLGVRPGDKVLEAGAATGYNAALLARLAGPAGHVWSVDVDEDLVRGVAAHLKAADVVNATVVLGDGAVGLPAHAPFDRVQFTVGTADIPPAILDQVGPGGRLVIPMRVRGSISRSFAFERDGGGPAWTAVSHEMATFVPLRKSTAQDARARVPVASDGTVTVEAWDEQDTDRDALATVLDAPGVSQWTDVKFRKGDPWEWAYLWLATVLPGGISRMPGRRPGYTPHFSWGSMAALDGATLAYLTIREGDDDAGQYWEIGTTGHGPRAASLARDMADAIREWDRDYGNQAPPPGARLIPAAHRDLLKAADPRFAIDKPASRLVIDWRR
jgi:protein-L-isoaspartate(D-aspartate) O-methyltransferase